VFDGLFPILIVPRHIGTASIKKISETLCSFGKVRDFLKLQMTEGWISYTFLFPRK